MKSKKSNFILIALYLSTIAIFVIIFSKIDFPNTLKILKETILSFFLIAVLLNFISLGVHAAKWRQLLTYLGLNIPLKEALFLEISSMPTRILLPLKSGELIQALYLKKKKQFPLKKGAFSLIISAFYDLCTLIFYILVGLVIVKVDFSNIIFWAFTTISLFIITSLLIFFFKRKYVFKIHKNIIKIFDFFKNTTLKRAIFLFLYSMLFNFITLWTYFFIFKSLSISVPFKELVLFIPILLSLTQIPITISGFGTREALIIYLFSNYAPQENLFAVGILVALIMYVIPSILSIFFQKRLLKNIF